MSIADELNKLIPELEEAYAAIAEVGGTVPEQKNFKNLKVAIESIPGGAPDAYVFLYNPDKPEEVDYTDDAQDIINIMNGSGYLPNNNGYTHMKFTPKCQGLNITAIGNRVFLCPKIEVVEGLDNFTKVTTIGDQFLLDSRISATLKEVTSWPQAVTTIGTNFLGNCSLFNSPIDMPNLKTIGNSFLYSCKEFNHPIDLTNVQSIGSSFLGRCSSFNHPLDFSKWIELPSETLFWMTAFNSEVKFNPRLEAVGYNSFSHCANFNQPVPTSQISVFGNLFVYLDNFNQPISLENCIDFEGSLTHLPKFNQPLVFPADCDYLQIRVLLYGSNNYTSTITINTTREPDLVNDYTLAADSPTAVSYTQGFKITGPGASVWRARLADISSASGNIYRKLVVV